MRKDRLIPMKLFETLCLVICGFVLVGTLSSTAWAQAIIPLSGTKGASAINDGVGHFRQRNWDTASSHFRKALQKNPRSAVAHYNLGLALNRMGKPQQAAKHFQKASQLGQINPLIRNSTILKKHLQQSKQ